MKSNKLICVAALLLSAPTIVASNTLYVDGANGNDSDTCTSPATPCKTIGHALSLATSGNSIVVAAGTYKENLSLTFSLNIIGAGASTTIVDGGGVARVVEIPDPNTLVSLSNMTLRDGHSAYGAGILNYGKLTLNHIILSWNFVSSPSGFGGSGGAIANLYPATLTINHSTISDNAVHSSLNVSLGGGIVNFGTLTISNSTISGNTVRGVGFNGGTNHTRGAGISNFGTLWVNNSTISANVVVSAGTGGGIFNSGTLTLNNTTFSANTANSGGAISNTGATAIQNSIVANSTGGNCTGSIVSKGYNLSSDGTCHFNAPGDLNNHDPLLGPLQNNGGPTPTMALLSGSPAIDSGNPNGCTDGNGHLLTTDQRGLPRPDKEDTGRCDIGAYERQSD